jgi:hypothetical protein
MPIINFSCGHAKEYPEHYANWFLRNKETTLCANCYSPLINIHRWGVWEDQEYENLKPLGGKIVVRPSQGQRAIALIKRKIQSKSRYNCVSYKGKLYTVFHGQEYKTIYLTN